MTTAYEVKVKDVLGGVVVYIAATPASGIVTRLYERKFKDLEAAIRHADRLRKRVAEGTV